MKTQAAVFQGPGKPLALKEYPLLDTRADSVLIKMESSGICGTDIHISQGAIPIALPEIILGHEAVGIVRKLGSENLCDATGSALTSGDRVIIVVAEPCGKCSYCQEGDFASCQRKGVTYFKTPDTPPHLHGGFSNYIHHPALCTVKVPQQIPLEAVAAYPCAGPTLLQAVEYGGGLQAGEKVLVQGSGPVGLFATLYAKKRGLDVIFFGSSSNPKRLELASLYGADKVVDIRKKDETQRAAILNEWTGGAGVDIAIEASGNPAAFSEGLSSLRTRGRYLVPGQYSNRGPSPVPTEVITFKAVRIFGSGQYAIRHVVQYIKFLSEEGMAELATEAVTHKLPLSKINDAFALAQRGEGIKILLTP